MSVLYSSHIYHSLPSSLIPQHFPWDTQPFFFSVITLTGVHRVYLPMFVDTFVWCWPLVTNQSITLMVCQGQELSPLLLFICFFETGSLTLNLVQMFSQPGCNFTGPRNSALLILGAKVTVTKGIARIFKWVLGSELQSSWLSISCL